MPDFSIPNLYVYLEYELSDSSSFKTKWIISAFTAEEGNNPAVNKGSAGWVCCLYTSQKPW